MSSFEKLMLNCVEIGKAITATLNMDQILSIIIQRLSELMRAQNWTLYLLDPDRNVLNFEVVAGLDNHLLSEIQIKPGEGIAGQVALTGEPILVPDNVYEDRRFNRHIDEMTGFKTRSIICFPLKARDEVLGVLEVINPEDSDLFEERFRPIFSILSDFVAIAIVNARNYEKIQRLVVTDDVTGQYNTRFMHDHLERLIQQGREISLVFLDLDDFKQVVDAHGHQLGSQMLKEVAMMVAGQLEPDDCLVHYGGDEFVIILPAQDKQTTIGKLEAIRREFSETLFLQSEQLNIHASASFGIANYPQDASDTKTLLQLADKALYYSKDRGKNTISMV